MTNYYDPVVEEQKNRESLAASYLKSLGISPDILNLGDRVYHDTPESGHDNNGRYWANYDYLTRKVNLPSDFTPHELLHEYFHAVQDNLSDEDKLKLQDLITNLPPDGTGQTGFTNYPQGVPTQHHSVGQGYSTVDSNGAKIGFFNPTNWKDANGNPIKDYNSALPTYIDYSVAGFQPYNQIFRSDIGHPWQDIPQPILDFIKERYPYQDPLDELKKGQKSMNLATGQ